MRRCSCLALLTAAALLCAPLHAVDRRIVAVADVHGAGSAFTSILERAGIIDQQRHWAGGTAVLVQTGDIMDRGPDVRMLLDFLIRLEAEAAAAGGRVERLLGNHEIMNLVGFTRDATPEIFASWADSQSEPRRERAFEEARQLAGGSLDKTAWLTAHPPGFIEYREAFGPTGRYGRWLRTKPVVVKINDTIFMHAGIAPGTAPSLAAINDRVKADLQAWDTGVRWLLDQKLILPFATMPEVTGAADVVVARIMERTETKHATREDPRALMILQPVAAIRQSSLFKGDGPLWFRGYSTWTDEEGAPLMAALLKQYNARRFVTGHTPQKGGLVRSRFDGGVFLIDTGMLGPPNFPGGRASALEIVGDRVTPIYGSERPPAARVSPPEHPSAPYLILPFSTMAW